MLHRPAFAGLLAMTGSASLFGMTGFLSSRATEGSLRDFELRLMKKKAITLVEMLAVIAIAGIILSVTGVGFSTLDKYNLEAGARNLLSDLSLAREMALSRHEDFIITFNRVAEEYRITNALGAPLDQARGVIRLAPINIIASPDTLTFQAFSGRIVLNPANANDITLGDNVGRTRQIRVFDQTGYFRLN